LHGWARSASGSAAEGIAWIEDAIRNYQVTGAMLRMPYFLALKAESLHLADRAPEALETIMEAEAWVERSEERWWSAELHRLRGVFLAAMRADKAQVEASFYSAIATAREQKSTSLAARAEATYAEYRSGKGEHFWGSRVPTNLC
jgi:predicted ATPase